MALDLKLLKIKGFLFDTVQLKIILIFLRFKFVIIKRENFQILSD